MPQAGTGAGTACAVDAVDYQVDFSRRRQRDSTLFMKATMRVDNDFRICV